MKFLIISDSHGNFHGLEAVLRQGAARGCEKSVCRGDIVGYGAHPNECCELLREQNAICLSGNHDAAVLGKINDQWFNTVAQTAVRWTRAQLSPQNRIWLDSLPAHRVFEEWDFEVVHASLREPWEEYITHAEIARPNFPLMQTALLFFGHTHQTVCAAMTADRSAWQKPIEVQWVPMPGGGEIEVEAEELTMVNPGSCGQPRDGNALAKGAIFDSQARSVEIFGVEYDAKAARNAILEAGLPRMLGDRLLRGQ